MKSFFYLCGPNGKAREDDGMLRRLQLFHFSFRKKKKYELWPHSHFVKSQLESFFHIVKAKKLQLMVYSVKKNVIQIKICLLITLVVVILIGEKGNKFKFKGNIG